MKRLQLVGLGISTIAVIWLIRTHDFSALPGLLGRLGPGYALAAIACAMGSLLLRAARWRLLFGTIRPAMGQAFSALTIGYLFNNLLPGRAGDVVRAYVLGESAATSKGRALGTVALERVADVLVLGALLGVVTLTYPLPGWFGRGVRAVAITAAAGVLALVAVHVFAGRTRALIAPLLDRLPPRVRAALVATGRGFLDGIRGLSGSAAVSFAIATVLIWTTEIALMWCIAAGFGLSASPLKLLFVTLFITLGTMIPSSPSYIGTFELFGVQAMTIVGFPVELSLAFVVTLHAVIILGTTLPGAVSLMRMHRRLPLDYDFAFRERAGLP